MVSSTCVVKSHILATTLIPLINAAPESLVQSKPTWGFLHGMIRNTLGVSLRRVVVMFTMHMRRTIQEPNRSEGELIAEAE